MKAQSLYEVNFKDAKVRAIAAQMLTGLLDRWDVKDSDQCTLLGLSESSRGSLYKYRSGERGIPEAQDTLERAGNLFAINKNLKMLYKHEEDGIGWMTRPNLQFKGEKPVDFMVKNGMKGIYLVRAILEHRRGR